MIISRVRIAAIGLCGAAIVWSAACGKPAPIKLGNFGSLTPGRTANPRIILDFETPSPPVEWVAAPSSPPLPPSSTPATAPAPPALTRNSDKPHTGLWSLKTRVGSAGGDLVHHFDKPTDLQNFDTVSAAVMHLADAGRSGETTGTVFLEDDHGKRVTGDAFPITTQWKVVPLDLRTAVNEGLDLGAVTAIGVELRAAPGQTPEALDVQTDTWCAAREHHTYLAQGLATAKTFYAQQEGTKLIVGMADHYEMTFYQRSGNARPWLSITQPGAGHDGPQLVLGQPGTGLMLLDQAMYDGVAGGVHQDAEGTGAAGATAGMTLPTMSWPQRANGASEWSWECTWASPLAVIVEVRQEVGPFDRLGQPAAAVKWRFMIYQWGQVFVHAEWTKAAGVADPISWALVRDDNVRRSGVAAEVQAKTPADAERLLSGIYPASVRQGLTTALPHQMQKDAPVAMLAKTGAVNEGKNNWWWADGGGRRIFGVGFQQRQGPLDCMLLVNSPSQVMQAGSFAQYLVPPKLRVRQGEADRNFPGDADNDGLVEPYGFQVVRLSNGRTSFMIYPQERPLFYPPFLFTVPAVERESLDVKNSRMLVNIDGKQFADPPQFPDGSFLLQMPYVIDRPVQVEAILVKR